MKILLAVVLAMLSSIASAATTPPKVVFIGDYITYNWKSAFAANPNWINKGINGAEDNGQTSGDVLARFQKDVVSLHPAIVHILVGAADVQTTSSSPTSTQYLPDSYAANLDAIVKAAKAAGIKVILGTTPGTGDNYDFALPYINSIIAAYGAANDIEVVNYVDALCECVGALGNDTDIPNSFQQPVTTVPAFPSTNPGPYSPTLLPTTSGYSLMTQLAETAVANEYLTLQSGHLSNVITQSNDNIGVTAGQTNLNTVQPEANLQFIPIGVYSDGSSHPQNNTLWDGANGTWTSSNPLVMSVNQQGLAIATTAGTATIRYTPANSVYFHSWVMTVQ